MKNRPVKIILLGFIFLATAGLAHFGIMPAEIFKTHNVKIEKAEDNSWRVRDNNGKNKGTMEVQPGDKINWHINGSDMVFIFKEDLKEYFDFDRGKFGDGRTQKMKKREMLRVTVKENAPKGTLEYEVYVMEDNKSVIGNSPPKIIIR